MADQIKTNTVGEVSSPATEAKAEAPKRKEPIFAAPQSKNEPAASAAKAGAAEPASENANGGNSLAEKKKRPLPVFADEVNANDNGNEESQELGDEEIGAFAAPVTVDASELVNEQPMEEAVPMGVAMHSIGSEYPDPTGDDTVMQGFYGPITLKNDKYDDPGRLEAEVLLAEYKADKIARKERKANKGNKAIVVPAVMPVDIPDFDDDDFIDIDDNESDAANGDAYAEDPGRLRAETMLADHKADVASRKATKQAKRNQSVAPETVVADKEYDVSEPEYDEPDVTEEASAAPLTTAVADNTPKKEYEEIKEAHAARLEPIFKDEVIKTEANEEPSIDTNDDYRASSRARNEDADDFGENTAIAVIEIEDYDATAPKGEDSSDEESTTDEPFEDSSAEPTTDEPSKEKSSGDEFFADNFVTDAYDDYLYDKDLKARKRKELEEPRIKYNEVNYFNDDDPMGEYHMDKKEKKEERKAAKLRAEYIAEAEAQVEANDWWGARADDKPTAKVDETPRTIFVPVGIPVGDKKLADVIAENYPDYNGAFDEAAYYAEAKAKEEAKAKAKAENKAEKAETKAEKAEAKTEKLSKKYDAATARDNLKADQKEELLTHGKADIKEQKARKAEEKAEAKAERLAKKNYVAPIPTYEDHTENFDKEAYDAEKQAIADSEAKVKADAAAAKAEKKSASEAKIASSYDKATGEQLAKMERKAELISTNKQAAIEKKELKAKSETKAGQLTGAAAAETAALLGDTTTTIFGDFTESFDKAAYDAEKQAIIDAAAKAKAETKAAEAKAKAARQAENAAKAEAKIASSYDKATGEQLAKMERKAELVSTNAQAIAESKAFKAEAKTAKAEAKAGRQAAKIAAASTVPPIAIFADYLESFDKAAYDAEKQAIADAEAKAKAEAKALKFERRAASEAKAEAEIAAAYDKATGKQLAKMERQAELVSANSQAAADKTARVAAKAELTAPKLTAAESTIPAVAIFGDYTESFDKDAYEAEKQAALEAEAKAKADAKAEAASAKAERKHASEARAEAKIATAYDKATGEQIAKMERKSDLVSANKQALADRKTLKDNARNEKQSIRLAKQSEVAPVTFFDDFTEAFDKAEYDREKTASAESLAAKEKADAINKQLGRVAAKNQKDIKATEMLETKLADGEMLDFAKTYRSDIKKNKKQLERSEKYGKFMLEYGSTFDPEWDGEFNNYGLPENDPLTEGVKLSTSRRRTPKKEKLSAFDVTKLTSLARMQRDTDNQMVVARVQSEFADLELEVAKAQQDFAGDFRNRKEKRWLRNSKKKLGSLRAKIALAEKYEKLDNDRYYSVVTTNFDTVALPARADRDELIAMREELMRLLDIRDEINAELIQLYTGTAKNGGVNHIKRRNKVVLKARKRAHKKYRKHYNALNKYHVTRNEKMRVCDKLDEIVELSGELARIKYILKKENPIGKARREYIREKGNAKSNLRYAKRYAERFTVKAVRRAKIRKRRTRAFITSIVLLALLGAGALSLYILGPHLLEMAKPMIPEQFHQYIDMILGAWPKK